MAHVALTAQIVPCVKSPKQSTKINTRHAVLLARTAFCGSSVRHSQSAKICKASRQGVETMALFGGASTANKSFYDYTVSDIDGKKVDLNTLKGKVVLVVNVASQCGFTPQYKDLQRIFSQYNSKGFTILGFPCNQFGGQEPGSNAEIKAFAARQGATFPMMSKVDVNGGDADPLYGFLKSKAGGLLTSDIKWNFTKFLVDREGNVVKRYGSTATPADIEKDLAAYL